MFCKKRNIFNINPKIRSLNLAKIDAREARLWLGLVKTVVLCSVLNYPSETLIKRC